MVESEKSKAEKKEKKVRREKSSKSDKKEKKTKREKSSKKEKKERRHHSSRSGKDNKYWIPPEEDYYPIPEKYNGRMDLLEFPHKAFRYMFNEYLLHVSYFQMRDVPICI